MRARRTASVLELHFDTMAAPARRRRSNIKLEAQHHQCRQPAARGHGVVTVFMEHMLIGESSADVSTMRVTVAARRPRACRRWVR